MTDDDAYRPSTADRVGIWIYMIAGLAIIVWTGVFAVGRLLEVSLGERIPVTVRPIGLELEATGSGGEPVAMEVDTATVTVSRLASGAYVLEILRIVVVFAATAAVVVCLLLLARDALRGRIFGRRSTSLVTTAGISGLAGYGTALALEGAVGGSVFAALELRDAEGFAVLVGSPPLFILAGFALAVILTAYTVGARMQRETEGLV